MLNIDVSITFIQKLTTTKNKILTLKFIETWRINHAKHQLAKIARKSVEILQSSGDDEECESNNVKHTSCIKMQLKG